VYVSLSDDSDYGCSMVSKLTSRALHKVGRVTVERLSLQTTAENSYSGVTVRHRHGQRLREEVGHQQSTTPCGGRSVMTSMTMTSSLEVRPSEDRKNMSIRH